MEEKSEITWFQTWIIGLYMVKVTKRDRNGDPVSWRINFFNPLVWVYILCAIAFAVVAIPFVVIYSLIWVPNN